MRTMIPVFAMVAAGCLGGANKLKGEIDGNEVKVLDGYFVQEDEVDPATGDGLMVIVLTDLDDACQTNADVNDEIEDAETASDLEEIWEDLLPEDFWDISLVLRVSDPGDDLSDVVFDGVSWDDVLEKDDEVFGVITHYRQTLDEDFWNGVEDAEDYLEEWYTDGGDLEVTKHEPNTSIKGSFVTEAATTDDGDNAGDIEVMFSVERCQAAERYYFE